MTVLATNLCGVPLRNPLIAASGTAGYGPEIADVVSETRFGAITTKSITPESRDGNPPWRVTDLPAGMLNAIGLANLGLARFVDEVLPALDGLDTVMIGSIAGHRIDDYVEVAAAFGGESATALRLVELNVSCPNTATGRLLGSDPDDLATLVAAARDALGSKPMLVKLSPGESDVAGLAIAAVRAGADGLTVANTYPAMSIDPETRRSRIGRAAGGMSGPAVHPIAVKLVHDVRARLAAEGLLVPIIGLGGVQSWSDAAEFVLAGATGVGIGTGLFVDPGAPKRVVRGLEGWVRRQGFESVEDLVGGFEP